MAKPIFNNQTVAHESNGTRIVIMSSLGELHESNADDIVVCGSHGGASAARHALRFKPKGVIVNDAGRGKDDAGIAGLPVYETAGIMGAAVDAFSARIGDGLDSYNSGVVSAANDRAKRAGVKVGMAAKDAARIMHSFE
jgi:hypothetical protein